MNCNVHLNSISITFHELTSGSAVHVRKATCQCFIQTKFPKKCITLTQKVSEYEREGERERENDVHSKALM